MATTTEAHKLAPLLNLLATPEQLGPSSSTLDRVPADLELSVRFAATRFIQAAAVLLHLPQDTAAQAAVCFLRYWLGPDGGSCALVDPLVRHHAPSFAGLHQQRSA